ncbi:DUF1769-domain-containing protein [Laetiporus sulphureus 93-53]|uniref:DUF1769-domain-containing protein n=1 Tax=Laetiporus sulphureus 93-53 TaxID=1314785 RepID=A0A165BKK1_9APHY|nr:DUF1769-domain-containing protein [Laetiporus sulphureus 93-53]KZT01226.1 DUF1769-domain-containing protein [Laetiporus sulphureus 93-53]
MPRLRILAGPSIEEVVPVVANSDLPLDVKSDAFEGKILVYIKGFADAKGQVRDSPYFKKRPDVTWSFQVQGRFLRPYNADDIMFGNVFERPLQLPWGFSAALKFMKYVDPTLDQDLASSSKPWALSPFVSTMPYLEHRRIEVKEGTPPFPLEHVVGNDISQLSFQVESKDGNKRQQVAKDRRSFFKDAIKRKEVIFGPADLFMTDFCYDYLRFSPDGVDLRLPGGISIDMMKYWDGQPVRFVCCERARKGENAEGVPWGRVLWCIVIEAVQEDEEEDEDADIE